MPEKVVRRAIVFRPVIERGHIVCRLRKKMFHAAMRQAQGNLLGVVSASDACIDSDLAGLPCKSMYGYRLPQSVIQVSMLRARACRACEQ
jgi:hypothetical protein